MRIEKYDVLPILWNEEEQEYQETGEIETFASYREACKYARTIGVNDLGAEGAKIEATFVETTDYDNPDDLETALYDSSSRAWVERFIEGDRYPAIFLGDRPIWRWDFGELDLYPRRKRY